MRPSVFGRPALRIASGVTLSFLFLAGNPGVLAQGGRSNEHWVGTWATAVVARPQGPQGQGAQAPQPVLNFSNQTLRQIVHTSIGGERVRVVFSNAYGTAPLAIGAAHIAIREKGAAIVQKSDRALTFGGGSAITIPAGAVIVSDPATLSVPAFTDLAVDLYLSDDTAKSASPLTIGGRQTTYVSQPGDQTGAADMQAKTAAQTAFFLARVEVTAPGDAGAVVAIGDSITAAAGGADTNDRWTDELARRLIAQNIRMGVLNEGIGGNRVLSEGANGSSALARFDRDVLVQTGVTHVIVLEGINDIGRNPSLSVADLIAGHRQLIERAHARGLKIYGATVTPVEGTTGNFAAYFSPDNEAKRTTLNEWIRTSKAYDGVIDFDAAMRDPNHPTKLLAQYSSDDHIHPNVAGYQAMGKAIDLALFKAGQPTTGTR